MDIYVQSAIWQKYELPNLKSQEQIEKVENLINSNGGVLLESDLDDLNIEWNRTQCTDFIHPNENLSVEQMGHPTVIIEK